MRCVSPAEIGFAVERFDPHLAHQTPDALTSRPVAVVSQEGAECSTACARNQVQFVNPAHQCLFFCRRRVPAGNTPSSAATKNLALPADRQTMVAVDHLLALSRPAFAERLF